MIFIDSGNLDPKFDEKSFLELKSFFPEKDHLNFQNRRQSMLYAKTKHDEISKHDLSEFCSTIFQFSFKF